MEPLLGVRNLHVSYGGRPALEGIEFDLARGEVMGINGRSGSGKSTLALALLKALPGNAVVSGEVKFGGATMAPVFQEASGALNPFLTAGQQVIEVLRARRDPGRNKRRAVAEHALDSAGLAPGRYFDAWPHQLSGGEKQRVLLAQAIAGHPDLIIADEPTASLDCVAQRALIDLLRDLRARMGLSLILISHSPALLDGFASRTFAMQDGRFVPDAP
jgi:ABC-type glutathione transport system ATPase component